MVTLRSYANSIEAGLAKSRLEGRNVACELADENANAYGGAPLAMPVRLLVREEQLEEAKQALPQLGPELRSGFSPAALDAGNQNGSEQLTRELRELQHRQGWIMLLAVVTIFYCLSHR